MQFTTVVALFAASAAATQLSLDARAGLETDIELGLEAEADLATSRIYTFCWHWVEYWNDWFWYIRIPKDRSPKYLPYGYGEHYENVPNPYYPTK